MTAEIPLEGSVGDDVVIAGPGWDSQRRSLMLGTVSGKAGHTTRLVVTIRGEGAAAVRPVVRRVVPEGLVEGCRLLTDVAQDQPISWSQVEPPTDSLSHRLYREMVGMAG